MKLCASELQISNSHSATDFTSSCTHTHTHTHTSGNTH